MNSQTQLKVQAYLDNELTPSEARQIAALLSSDPLARDLYTELKETKEIVRQNEPALTLPESRDFYWSKIQREISKAAPATARPSLPWWTRLLAPVAGAVALFAILLSISGPGTTPKALIEAGTVATRPVAPLHQGEVVSPEMSAVTFRSEADGVTVVWVSSDAPEPPRDLEWWE